MCPNRYARQRGVCKETGTLTSRPQSPLVAANPKATVAMTSRTVGCRRRVFQLSVVPAEASRASASIAYKYKIMSPRGPAATPG
jgi:hypothetical protein